MAVEPPISPSAERTIRRFFPWIIAALAFTVIAPSLWSGWLSDDAFYSVLDGVIGADRTSLGHAMAHAFDLWFLGSGRFYPLLIAEKYLVFAAFTNLIAYKALLVAATLATLEAFRRCVAAYSSRAFGNLCALVAVALFALRGYSDPILSYNAMPQLVALALLGSALAFRYVLDTRQSRWSAASIALYALAALTWEDAYPFAFLYVAIARCHGRSWREALQASAPFLAIAAALTLLSIALRAAEHVPAYSAYGIDLSPAAVVRTFADQLLAALPLSYYTIDPSHIFSRRDFYDFYNNAPVNPILFIAFLPAIAYALSDAAHRALNTRAIAAVGILTMALAAFPITILVKYQHELRPGLGYLPVFYEELGLALVLGAVATNTMRGRRRVAWQVGWSVAIAALATMTQATNARLVREDAPPMESRRALERELDGGLLASIHDGTFITIAPTQDWIAYDGEGPEHIGTRGLFFLHGRKRVHLVAPSDARVKIALVYDETTRHWDARIAPFRNLP